MATISQINEFIIANGGEEKIVDITIDGLYLIRAIGGDGGGHRDKQTAPSGMHPGGGTGSEVLTYVYLRAGDSVTQMGGQSGKGRTGGKCGTFTSGGNGGKYSQSPKRGSNGFGGGGASCVLLNHEAGSLADETVRDAALIVAGAGGGATGGGAYSEASTKAYTYTGNGGSGGNAKMQEDGHISGGYGYGFALTTYPSDHDSTDELSEGGRYYGGNIIYGQYGIGQSGVNGSYNGDGKGAENGRGGAGGGFVGGTACQRTKYGSYPGAGGGSSYIRSILLDQTFGAESFAAKYTRASNGQSYEQDGFASIRLHKTHFVSDVTADSPLCDIGGSVLLNIHNPVINSVKHRVTFSHAAIETTEGVSLASGVFMFDEDIPFGIDSYVLTIPPALANFITDSLSATIQINLETYTLEGELVGSSSFPLTVKIPGSLIGDNGETTIMIPTVNISSVESITKLDDEKINLVAGYSGHKYTIEASGVYNSTFTKLEYRTNLTSGWTSFTGNSFEINPVQSGMDTVYVQATDSRGRSGIAQYHFDTPAVQYSIPNVNLTYYRCLQDGKADSLGQWCYLRGKITGTDIGGTNTITAMGYYREAGVENWEPIGSWMMDDSQSYDIPAQTFGDGLLNIEKTYEIRFEVVDEVTANTYTFELDTALFTLFWKQGGNAVGFGCPTDKDNAVVLSKQWRLYHGDIDILRKLNDGCLNIQDNSDFQHAVSFNLGEEFENCRKDFYIERWKHDENSSPVFCTLSDIRMGMVAFHIQKGSIIRQKVNKNLADMYDKWTPFVETLCGVADIEYNPDTYTVTITGIENDVGSGKIELKWAGLFPGELDISPMYVPKGYTMEYENCLAYYQRINAYGNLIPGILTNTNTILFHLNLQKPMFSNIKIESYGIFSIDVYTGFGTKTSHTIESFEVISDNHGCGVSIEMTTTQDIGTSGKMCFFTSPDESGILMIYTDSE